MQPFFALTYTRAVERVVGTALGGLVAAGGRAAVHHAAGDRAGDVPAGGGGARGARGQFRAVHAGADAAGRAAGGDRRAGHREWRIALARAALTIVGGLVAVAASFLLWPSREPERLVCERAGRDRRARPLRRGANWPGCSARDRRRAVETARRDAGVASNSLEASINRALIEQRGGGRDRLEAVLVIDAALRRCAGRLSAMQLDPGVRAGACRRRRCGHGETGSAARCARSPTGRTDVAGATRRQCRRDRAPARTADRTDGRRDGATDGVTPGRGRPPHMTHGRRSRSRAIAYRPSADP